MITGPRAPHLRNENQSGNTKYFTFYSPVLNIICSKQPNSLRFFYNTSMYKQKRVLFHLCDP